MGNLGLEPVESGIGNPGLEIRDWNQSNLGLEPVKSGFGKPFSLSASELTISEPEQPETIDDMKTRGGKPKKGAAPADSGAAKEPEPIEEVAASTKVSLSFATQLLTGESTAQFNNQPSLPSPFTSLA